MLAKRNSPAWTGWIMFAALMLLIIGCVNVVEGIVGLVYRQRTVLVQNVLYVVDLSGWALTLVIFGGILALAGIGLLAVRTWARVVAIVVVVLHAIAQIGWLAAYPVWSLLMLALDVVVLYALTARWPDTRDMAVEFTPTSTYDSPTNRNTREYEESRETRR